MQRTFDKERFLRDSARYLAIVEWAKRRYTIEGRLLTRGPGLDIPSRFTRIEDLAAVKYLGLTERWPGFRVWQCPPLYTTAFTFKRVVAPQQAGA